ncbi:hypothetical protein [Streptococcus pluranimalium]|uniref:Uncharacterized protein n=1 Tax=Streptococcus pluranimalium TaxID=82348 RepID=A0A345VJG7_9STRE|nr:hypothetical protein [Streptococcus pluranimalium]AXJ12869.1 hypothetical protein Sp14A_09480 [Streptococcus pluranimalium]
MKKNSLIVSLVIILIVCLIGGCRMFGNKEEEVKYKKDQDRMVEYLGNHYKGVKKIEFKNFEKNIETGYYTSVAEIDDKFEVMFYERGIGGEISLDYYTKDFIIKYPKISESNNLKSDIKVIYYGE